MRNQYAPYFQVLAGATICLSVSGISHAQQESSQSRATAIEKVVVTARRREKNMQQVPIAVSALSKGDLEFPRDLSNSTVVGTFQIPRTYGVDSAINF